MLKVDRIGDPEKLRKGRRAARSRGRSAAGRYSLVGTANLCHLDPGSYLRQALEAALSEPSKVSLPF